MHRCLKNTAIVLLIVAGGCFGYFLGRQNRELFELPSGHSQKSEQGTEGVTGIHIGMDTWQVREMLGPPDKRIVISENQGARKVEWVYGDQHLYFVDGLLTAHDSR